MRRVRLIFGPPRRSRLTICGVIRRVRLIVPETTLSRVSDPRGGGCAATLAPRMIESVRPQEAQSTGVGTHLYCCTHTELLEFYEHCAEAVHSLPGSILSTGGGWSHIPLSEDSVKRVGAVTKALVQPADGSAARTLSIKEVGGGIGMHTSLPTRSGRGRLPIETRSR